MMHNEHKNILKDIKKYKDMCDIADILVEISSGKRALNIKDENVVAFLNDQDKVETLIHRLDNNSQCASQFNRIISLDKERDTQLLLTKLNTAKKRHRILQLRKIASVAAILIVSFCLIFAIKESNKVIQVADSNINTSHDMPIIIFPNGKTVDIKQSSSDKMDVSKYILANNRIVKHDDKDQGIEDEKEEYHTIVIPSKKTYDIELADGTQVTLNANSRLKFPAKFSGSERYVELNGEAYFKVAKSTKPFIVTIGNSNVRVYGTEFNINTDKGNTVETILVEGSIGFTAGTNREIILKPNQLIKMNKDNNSCTVSYVDVDKYLGWKSGCFLYEQETLKVILNDIASWYGVSFSINNKMIETTELSINLDKNMELLKLLDHLEKMLNMKIINEGNNQYIIQ